MPRPEDLELFKRDLASLSRESEVLAQWGEAMEEPSGSAPVELDAEVSSRVGEGKKTSEDEAPSFADLLDDLGLESDASTADAEIEALLGPSGQSDAASMDLDLDALLGLGSESPKSPPSPESPADNSFDTNLGDLEAAEKAAGEEEDILGDFDLAAFAGEMESAADEVEPTESQKKQPLGEGEGDSAASEKAPDETESAFDFSNFGSAEAPSAGFDTLEGFPDLGSADTSSAGFDAPEGFPDFDTASEESLETASTASPETADGFAPAQAPDSEAFSFDDLLPAEAAETFSTETATPEAAAFESTEGAAGGGDFDFGDLGDLGADFSSLGEAPTEKSASKKPEPFGEADSFEEPLLGEPPAKNLEDTDEFSIPDFGFGSAESPSAAEEPAETAGMPADSAFASADFGAMADTGTAPELDAFDSFNFDENSTPELSSEDLDRELAALGEEGAGDANFSLESEWGEEIAPGKTAESAPSGRRPGPPPRAGIRAPGPSSPQAAARGASEEKVRPVSLGDAQVDRLQDNLLALPLNVRVAVEDAIANERGTEAQRSRLVWMLVEGAKAEAIAVLAGKMVGKRLAIPKGYEKSTGAAFATERGSIGYVFVHTILPLLKTALLVTAVVGIFGYLGWRFVYKPLVANALYRTGYARIGEERYPEAEEAFAKATDIREFKAWYYSYAEAYGKKKRYLLAEKKYEDLTRRYPKETRGALDWALLEKEQLKFKEAADILQKRVLERDYLNKDALLLLGDVYLAWAEEDPKYYEEARRNYAGLIQKYGSDDLYLERMLLYFMRTNVKKEVLSLEKRFMSDTKPFPSANTLAELGGWLIDAEELGNVRDILLAAATKDPSVPEAHYHLARYFRRSNAPGEERKALDNAISTFSLVSTKGPKRLGMFIDALIRRGNFRLDAKEYVAAEEDFTKAAEEYDRGLELRRLPKSPRFAEAYAGLAEVAYWMRDDLDRALSLLERAANHGFDGPTPRYKRGYIQYSKGRFADALEQFYIAGREGDETPYLLFAFGNALYARKDYYAAEAYFRRTVNAMKRELEAIDQPAPQERPSQAEIVDLLLTAQNNLGATRYRVANRIGDPRIRTEAMAAFAESSRLFDSMTRDRTTFVRSEAKNLGFLNMDFILHPQRGMDMATYMDIERDMRFPRRR